MTGEIAESIGNMTHLLRYICSGKATVVTLGDEIEYARRYLACMKARYRENLSYAIEVPEVVLGVRVPKLIIQPIIENAIKYGLAARPPWRIDIAGGDGPGAPRRWTVSVTGQRARLPGAEAAGPAGAARVPRGGGRGHLAGDQRHGPRKHRHPACDLLRRGGAVLRGQPARRRRGGDDRRYA